MIITIIVVAIAPPRSPAMTKAELTIGLLGMWRLPLSDAPGLEELNTFMQVLLVIIFAGVGQSLLSSMALPATVNMGVFSESIHD